MTSLNLLLRNISYIYFKLQQKMTLVMQLFDESFEFIFVEEANEFIDGFAAFDGDDGGHGLDLMVQGQVGELVNVDDGQMDFTLGGGNGGV